MNPLASEPSEVTPGSAKKGLLAFYGSRLFVKFFLWFWIAAVLTGVLATSYSYFYHFVPENRRMLRISREIIEDHGQVLVEAYEHGGIEEAALVSVPGMFWLFDAELNSLLAGDQNSYTQAKGRRLLRKQRKRKKFAGSESDVVALARRIFSGAGVEIEEIGGDQLMGYPIISESNKRYVIITHIPSRTYRHRRYLMGRLLDALPIFLLVTAIFCITLARYVVKPIAELRNASRRFAAGDLGARVGGSAPGRFDEIGDLAVDFNMMAEKIEHFIRGQRRLFGDISHELRSPLARMQVAVEILEKSLAEGDQNMCMRIKKELMRMNTLIEEVLQFSRIESGEFSENKVEEVDMTQLLRKVCEDADFEGSSRNCRVELLAEGEVVVFGVYELLERVVDNILRNAVKYSPADSVVRVEMKKEAAGLKICVCDRGPGISESELEKVFTPFYRCNEDRNRQTGGTGLGLAIAARAIKLHGGSISLQNHDDGGLMAEIVVPYSRSSGS